MNTAAKKKNSKQTSQGMNNIESGILIGQIV